MPNRFAGAAEHVAEHQCDRFEAREQQLIAPARQAGQQSVCGAGFIHGKKLGQTAPGPQPRTSQAAAAKAGGTKMQKRAMVAMCLRSVALRT